jgi:hypothetical protein
MKQEEYNINRELLRHFRYKGNELHSVVVVIQNGEITQLKILPLRSINPVEMEKVIR